MRKHHLLQCYTQCFCWYLYFPSVGIEEPLGRRFKVVVRRVVKKTYSHGQADSEIYGSIPTDPGVKSPSATGRIGYLLSNMLELIMNV